MIKANGATVEFSGLRTNILTEFSLLASNMFENGFSKEDILDAVNFGFLSDDEARKLVSNERDELAHLGYDMDKVDELIQKLIDDMEGGDDE